jgi:1-acyl-sn-glycerol-3-phosphate acyltransferase
MSRLHCSLFYSLQYLAVDIYTRMPFGFTHKPLVALANSAITSFFREIEVIGSENVPKEGPVILYV